MRLLVVSHTPHYRREGRLVGWGATVREVDHLAALFDEVVHVAPVHPESAPPSAIGYESSRVRVAEVRPSGGPGIAKKLSILRFLPSYARVILREMAGADVVHVRCPANISLLAVVLLALRREPRRRWLKYAGNWRPEGREALSYTFQRWWLGRGFAGGRVTVNGEWEGDAAHVRPFLNPCLTRDELEQGLRTAEGKTLAPPVRMVYVGRVEEEKGTGQSIRIVAELRRRGVAARLDVVGDGPERGRFELLARELGVEEDVVFHGWLPRPALEPLYRAAHFSLLPSRASEGWPKVLSEGMASGVVPLASTVSSVPQLLRRFGCGRAIRVEDVAGFADAAEAYLRRPELWKAESVAAVRAADAFGYDRHVRAVAELLELEPARELVPGRS